jgi:hypothetical protein
VEQTLVSSEEIAILFVGQLDIIAKIIRIFCSLSSSEQLSILYALMHRKPAKGWIVLLD